MFPNASSLLIGLGLILLLPSDTLATPGDTLFTQGDSVEVFQAPDDGAPIVTHLDRGQKLKEFRRQGTWVKVVIYGQAGQDGWVRSSDVGLEEPGASGTETTGSEVNQSEISPEPEEKELQPDTGPPFILVMEGFAAGFRATCNVVNHLGSTVRRKLSAAPPKAYSFDAAAVSCWVRNADRAGRLTVRLRKAGRLIASDSTIVSHGYVLVRSRGPWGKAYSEKCNRSKRICVRRTRPTRF